VTRINVPIQKLRLKTHGEKVSNLYQVERLVKRLQENGEPLTESLIQLLLYYDHLGKAGVHFFTRVSHNVGKGEWFFWFAPDADVIEVRSGETVVGYEIKGMVKARRGGYEMPGIYAGLDEALTYLVNPSLVETPDSKPEFLGSIFDFVYLVHPSDFDPRIAEMVEKCTPIGLATINYDGLREVVQARPNPFVSTKVKERFLTHIQVLSAFEKIILTLTKPMLL